MLILMLSNNLFLLNYRKGKRMKNAVILARVSSKEQEDGHSLEAQLANLESYAQRKDLNVIQVFRIIESSTKGNRPEFERMLDFFRKQKQRTALIVDCVDRLQRSFSHYPVFDALMRDDLLEIHFVREGNVLDRDATSSQKLMWNMGVVMAQSYTDQLSDNVKRSIKQKIKKGQWIAKAPMGYLNTTDTKTGQNTVVMDKERAFLIKRLFTDYATGTVSQRELKRKADAWGLRTLKGHKISLQTLNNIIHNPFYYGMMQIKGALYPHTYPPLIDKGLFDACQAVGTGKPNDAPRQTDNGYVLRGMVTCAVSGRKVSHDRKKGKFTYLIARSPENPEKKVWIKEEEVMAQIRDMIASLHVPDDLLDSITGYLRQTHEAEKQHHQESIKTLNRESEDLTGKLDRLTDCLLDQSITKDIYTKKHQEILQRQHDIAARLKQHHSADGQFKIALTMLISLASHSAQLFDCSKNDEKRELIGFLFSNLSLKGTTLCYSLKKPFDMLAGLPTCKEWRAWRDSNPRPLVP